MLLLGRLMGAAGILYGLLFWYIWWANGFFMVRLRSFLPLLEKAHPRYRTGTLVAVRGAAGCDDVAEQCIGGELAHAQSLAAECASEFPVLYRCEPGIVYVDTSSLDSNINAAVLFLLPFLRMEHGDGVRPGSGF